MNPEIVKTLKYFQTFRGAARLTYGQHPENDNDHTTTVKKPTTTVLPDVQEQDYTTESLMSDVLTKNGQRRSYNGRIDVISVLIGLFGMFGFILFFTFQSTDLLLRHANGQYSAFDVAQYIFWTGDEAGEGHILRPKKGGVEWSLNKSRVKN